MFGQKSAAKKKAAKNRGAMAKGATPDSTIATVQKMRGQITNVEKRVKHLNTLSLNLKKQAKNDVQKGDKSSALLKLQKKKIVDQQIANLSASLLQLESQKFELENSSTTYEIVNTMAVGAAAQKKLAQRMDPDKVANMMDEISDLSDQNQELNDIIASSGPANALDDYELEAELEALVAEEQESNIVIPAVPTSTANQTDTEADFDKLLAGLSDAPAHDPLDRGGNAELNDTDAERELAELEAQML